MAVNPWSSRIAFHVSMFIPVVLTPTSAIRDIAFSKLVYNDALPLNSTPKEFLTPIELWSCLLLCTIARQQTYRVHASQPFFSGSKTKETRVVKKALPVDHASQLILLKT